MGNTFAAVVAATLNVGFQVGALTPPSDPCRVLSVPPNREAPRLTGPEEITSRVRFLRQPDSPVSVTAIDFSKTKLMASTGSFDWTGSYALEIENVSDRPLRNMRAMVFVRDSHLSGVGSGVHFDEVLLPGARVRLLGNARGQGSGGVGDLTIDVLIESLRWEGCEYRPSQSIPLTETAK
jgi:hypothetical protein